MAPIAAPTPTPAFAPDDIPAEFCVEPFVASAVVVALAVAGAVVKSVACQRISTPYALMRPVSSIVPVVVARRPPAVYVKLYVVIIFGSGDHWQTSLVYHGHVHELDGRVEYVFPFPLNKQSA